MKFGFWLSSERQSSANRTGPKESGCLDAGGLSISIFNGLNMSLSGVIFAGLINGSGTSRGAWLAVSELPVT